MQNQWHEFLTHQGATFSDDGIASFGLSAQDEVKLVGQQNLKASLDHLGILHVTGADAQTFLQSQLSNDINHLRDEGGQPVAQLSAYCNPKGRILAQFIILPTGDDYLLITSRDIIDKTLMRLRMFVLRSQVVIENVSDSMAILGIIGKAPEGISTPANKDFAMVQDNDVINMAIPSASEPRFMVIGPIDKTTVIWQNNSDFSAVSHNVWLWSDIQTGLPNIVASTIEEFVPQMLNLELINGVSFKKGCYPGQEIVARMHYLGKPKRRMFKLSADTDQVPAPGTDLYLHDGDGQSAGKVVTSQPSRDKGIDLLAVIRLNHAGNNQLRLHDQNGPTVTFAELPYPLEQAE